MDWDGYAAGKYGESVELIRELTGLRRQYNLAGAEVAITAEGETLVVKRMTDEIELSLYINVPGRTFRREVSFPDRRADHEEMQ